MAIRTRSQAKKAKAPTVAKPRSRGTLAQVARALGASSRNVSPETKAVYHHVTGAGRSRIKRQFFDLNEPELQQLATLIETRLAKRLQSPVSRSV